MTSSTSRRKDAGHEASARGHSGESLLQWWASQQRVSATKTVLDECKPSLPLDKRADVASISKLTCGGIVLSKGHIDMDAGTPALIASCASAAAAMAAVGGFIFGVVKATKEVERARTEKQSEVERARMEKRNVKRAEVGGEVLVATLRFLSALTGVVSVFGRPQEDVSDDSRDEHAPFRRDVEQRWTAISDASAAFIHAWDLAQTYLPEVVDQFLERVWDIRATIRAGQMTFFSVPLGQGSEFFKQGFGGTPEKAIRQLHLEARALLRPIAQLEVASLNA